MGTHKEQWCLIQKAENYHYPSELSYFPQSPIAPDVGRQCSHDSVVVSLKLSWPFESFRCLPEITPSETTNALQLPPMSFGAYQRNQNGEEIDSMNIYNLLNQEQYR